MYSHLIEEIAGERGITGTDGKKWEWCLRTNGTYLECPIANYQRDVSFVAAVHNPSNKVQFISSVKTPHPNYKVQAITSKGELIDVPHAPMCSLIEIENGQVIQDCEFLLRYHIQQNDVDFFLFTYSENEKAEEAFPQEYHCVNDPLDPLTIQNDYTSLTIFEYDHTNGTLFKYENVNEDGHYVFSFDFRYYKSYQGDDEPASGAYIFRPDDNYQRSFRYSEMSNYTKVTSELAEEIHLMFDIKP